MRKVFYNGKFVDESDAKISIYDSALMFGDMVFEMTRSFNGLHWKLDSHIDRLMQGCKILRIDIPYTRTELLQKCEETAEINQQHFASDDEHRLLIDITRGALSIYSSIEGLHSGTNTIIADFPLRYTIQGCSHLYNSGVNLIVTNQKIIPPRYLDPKIKNRSRIHYMMANLEVSSHKGTDNWALLCDENGYIAEGTGSNFFMVKGKTLYTPKMSHCLRGITQASIIELFAPMLGLEVKICDIEPYDVYEADEAFVTSTPFCLLPVSSLNRIKLPCCPGPISTLLLQAWSDHVGVDIVSQINSWDSGSGVDMITPYKFSK